MAMKLTNQRLFHAKLTSTLLSKYCRFCEIFILNYVQRILKLLVAGSYMIFPENIPVEIMRNTHHRNSKNILICDMSIAMSDATDNASGNAINIQEFIEARFPTHILVYVREYPCFLEAVI